MSQEHKPLPEPLSERRSLASSIVLGARGFTMVSLAAFAVWAFHLHRMVGFPDSGLFTATAIVFVVLAGLILHPLLEGPRKLLRFYGVFAPAFVAYSVLWSVSWYRLHAGAGEWVGLLTGCLAFAWMATRLLQGRGWLRSGVILFVTNAAGYFLGGWLMQYVGGEGGRSLLPRLDQERLAALAKLSWGLAFGLGFGIGLGAVFHHAQAPKEPEAAPDTP